MFCKEFSVKKWYLKDCNLKQCLALKNSFKCQNPSFEQVATYDEKYVWQELIWSNLTPVYSKTYNVDQ